MKSLNRTIRGLVASVVLVGSLSLLGCPGGEHGANPATPSDVNNRSFTFTDGAAFHPALANKSTTLTFTNNANNFSLQSGGRTARGANQFGSCTLTVAAGGSDFPSGTGPQSGDTMSFPTCQVNDDNSLTLINANGVGATSAPAVVTGTSGG